MVQSDCRYNKLALDTATTIDEVSLFTPVQSPPLQDVPIRCVAMGTSHSALVTGGISMKFYTYFNKSFKKW